MINSRKVCGFVGVLDPSRWLALEGGEISFNKNRTVLSLCGLDSPVQTICVELIDSGKITFSHVTENGGSLYYSINGTETKMTKCETSIRVNVGDTLCFISRHKKCGCARIGNICFRAFPTGPI